MEVLPVGWGLWGVVGLGWVVGQLVLGLGEVGQGHPRWQAGEPAAAQVVAGVGVDALEEGELGAELVGSGWVVQVRWSGAVQVTVPSGASAGVQPAWCLNRWWVRHRQIRLVWSVGP